MNPDWNSYDMAAATHDRLGVPAIFAAPARDLAARMQAPPGCSWLDVGTGSGIVATVSGADHVVGVDPSLEMLRVARENGLTRVAAGAIPGLPFPARVFDRVSASFVLSHVPSYQEALLDMVRVLRPGGRLGVTAWGVRGNDYRDLWDSMVAAALPPGGMDAAIARGVPWEDLLGHPENVGQVLRDAGLQRVTVELISYPVNITIAAFLAIRSNSLSARFLRSQWDAARWERFRQTVEEEFHRRFRDPIDHTRDASIAVGDSADTTSADVRAEPALR